MVWNNYKCDLKVIVNSTSEFLIQILVSCMEFMNGYFHLVFSVNYVDALLVSILSLLYAFLVIFFFGRYFGSIGSGVFGLGMTFVSLVSLSTYIWHSLRGFWISYFQYLLVGVLPTGFQPLDVPIVRLSFGNWVGCSAFEVHWGFVFDPLSLFMMWVILFVTFVVQFYCFDYMFFDPFFSKFYSYLSIFAFFMLFLVVSDNYLQIFLGWEGVGLASFMLISFWSSRKDAVLAGMKAMFMNRFGDLFFIAALVVCLKQFGTLDFEKIRVVLDCLDATQLKVELMLLSLALVFASMAKSAQLGLHMWLPDAMEGPTPVSALIHAATMVTAGIFVLIRSSFILVLAPDVLGFMSFIGGLTALFGASVACVQFDIKRVIAYSTCSQLGYMMLACGSGNFVGAFFHLVNHAFFKALLFLGAGSVIHAMSNEQDMRKMGALSGFLPLTFIIMTFGSAALAGFPFFSGFYSKDSILEFAYSANSVFSIFGFTCGLVAASCTAFYSFRLLYLVFLGPYRGSRSFVLSIHDSPVFMSFSLLVLVIPSIFFGYIFSDLFVGRFGSWLWPGCISNCNLEWYLLPSFIKQAPTIFSFLGFLLAYLIYAKKVAFLIRIGSNPVFVNFYYFLARKWYFDDLFGFFVSVFMYANFKYFWGYFEQGFLVYIGPAGLARLFSKLSTFSDLWLVKVPLIYVKVVFYFFSVWVFVWFIVGNISVYLHLVIAVQIGIILYFLSK